MICIDMNFISDLSTAIQQTVQTVSIAIKWVNTKNAFFILLKYNDREWF